MIEGNIPWIAKTPRDDFPIASSDDIKNALVEPPIITRMMKSILVAGGRILFEAGKSVVPHGCLHPPKFTKGLGATSQVPDSIPWSFLWTCNPSISLDSGHRDHARYFQDLYKVWYNYPLLRLDRCP